MKDFSQNINIVRQKDIESYVLKLRNTLNVLRINVGGYLI